MRWYKHHLDAYERNTPELSLLQHGVYRRLLDCYYAREKPLPEKLSVLCRMIRAESGAERRALGHVLKLFFDLHEGAYFNSRADQEILSYQRQCSKLRRGQRGPVDRVNGHKNLDYRRELGLAVDLSLLHGKGQGPLKKLLPETTPAGVENNRRLATMVRDGKIGPEKNA